MVEMICRKVLCIAFTGCCVSGALLFILAMISAIIETIKDK
jgi:hypothetical protein